MAINVLTSATVVIEIVQPVWKLTICSEQAVSCQVCFNLTPGYRRCTLAIALHDHPTSA